MRETKSYVHQHKRTSVRASAPRNVSLIRLIQTSFLAIYLISLSIVNVVRSLSTSRIRSWSACHCSFCSLVRTATHVMKSCTSAVNKYAQTRKRRHRPIDNKLQYGLYGYCTDVRTDILIETVCCGVACVYNQGGIRSHAGLRGSLWRVSVRSFFSHFNNCSKKHTYTGPHCVVNTLTSKLPEVSEAFGMADKGTRSRTSCGSCLLRM